MIKSLITICFMLLVSFGFSQTASFKSTKVRIQDYGQSSNYSSFEPSEIVLDAQNGTVSVRTSVSEALEYLDYQNEMPVLGSKGAAGSTQIFFTEDFIFTINYRSRTIMVSKRNTNPQISALWFEEINY